jgi:replication factor A1
MVDEGVRRSMDVNDTAAGLAEDLDAEEAAIREDLENLLEYSVPLEEAKRSLRRKYGDGGGRTGGPEPVDVADITTEAGNVTVTGVVLTSGRRSIQYDGEEHVITEGEIADETGRISYTAWTDVDVGPGDAVQLGNVGVREWDGEPELNVGESTDVEPVEPMDVPYEIGGESDLVALETGDRGRSVEVRILEVERRTIDGRDGETEILSGVLADETARLPFTDWDPHPEIDSDASVRIENVSVREYRGVPEVQASEFSTVTELAEEVSVADTARELSLREAVASGGVFDVAVEGTVVDVREGSGLIERCPECNRVVQNGQCRTHGDVEGQDDMRVRAVLDDGTASCTLVLDRETTAAVYGGDLDDAREAAREAMDREVVAEAIAESIVGRHVRARGHLSVDDYGATLEATDFAEIDDPPAERAAAALETVRGVAATDGGVVEPPDRSARGGSEGGSR